MSRLPVETLAVVVALTDPATPRLGASLARFADEAGPTGEVLLVDASGDPAADGLARRFANVRLIRKPAGRLAPELWRDGLLATGADLVAFSTAQMTPREGWMVALRDKLAGSDAACVGGPIEAGSGLSATDRAVALLRYSGYFPPLPDPDRVEPPGDNALYRRDRLMEVESAWVDGFWEVDVHRALRDRGHSLAMAGSAVVTFEGGVGLASMARQRLIHARRYGAGRSKGIGAMARLARVAACPLVPPLLCGRIAAALKARGMGLAPWLPAVPSLLVLASAWAIGEAAGTCSTSSPLPLGEGPGVRGAASPSARKLGLDRRHSTGLDPHPGPLPKGEGGRTVSAPVHDPLTQLA